MEMNRRESFEEEYEVFDGCYGVVTSRCKTGVFLELDNGQKAFAYKFSRLLPGTEVLCTVLRLANGTRRMLVSIDSIVQYDLLAG